MKLPLREACVDSLHGLDVFGGDAEVMEVDLKASVCEVFDLEVFAVVVVVVGVGWDDDVVRRLGFDQSVGLRSAGVWFLLCYHVVVSRTNRRWAPKLLVYDTLRGEEVTTARVTEGEVLKEIAKVVIGAQKSKRQHLLSVS